ncbi:hypothetical protein GCM10020001_056360 [Nonomuraea salmonea]
MSDYSGSAFESAKRGAGALLSGALSALIVMVAMLAVMWFVEGVDFFLLDGSLDYEYGIIGWEPEGLTGIIFAPFLHIGFGHLIANSLPLLVLGFFAGLRDIRKFLWATVLIIFIGGIGTWLTSPDIATVGASGLVFGYFGFILARGLFDRRLLDIVIAIGVGVAYWGGSSRACCPTSRASPGRGTCSGSSAAWWPAGCCGASVSCRPPRRTRT